MGRKWWAALALAAAACVAQAQGTYEICDSLASPSRSCRNVSITTLGGRSLATQRVTRPGALLASAASRAPELALDPNAAAQMCNAPAAHAFGSNPPSVTISESGAQEFARIELRNATVDGTAVGAVVPVWLLRNPATGERFLQLRPQFENALAAVPGLVDTTVSLSAGGMLSSSGTSSGTGAALVDAVLRKGSALVAGATVQSGARQTLPSLWSIAEVAQVLDAFRSAYASGGSFPAPIVTLTCDTSGAAYTSCTTDGEMFQANIGVASLAQKYVGGGDEAYAELVRGFRGWASANALLTWVSATPSASNPSDLRFKYNTNNAITNTLLNVWSTVREDARTTAADRALVDGWLGTVAQRMTQPYSGSADWSPNNHGLLQASVAMSAAAMFGNDDAGWRKGLTWFAQALAGMRADGSLPYEIERGSCGLQYQNTAVASLVYIAALADRQGFDLFSVNENGRSVGKAVEFLLDATRDQSLADRYRVAGSVCSHPFTDPQHTELYTARLRSGGMTNTYAAWIDLFLRRFPNHPRRADLLSLVEGGVAAARPFEAALVGGPSSCLAAPTFNVAGETLMDRAEVRFPSLFNPPGARSGALAGFQYRYYPGTGNYLGIRDGQAYFLAPALGTGPVNVGPVDALLNALQ